MNYLLSLILAIVSYAIINNVILARFYGICSFVGVGNKIKSAMSMGIAVGAVIIVSTIICYPIYKYLLIPSKTTFLNTIVFILVIACLVQVTGLIIKKKSPALYKSLGIYLPLITTNCAVLGVVSENASLGLDFLNSLANAIGTSLGFFLVITAFAFIRERLDGNAVPKAFKGVPIALVTAAIMALALMGLTGVINI